jgi:sugar diacid utilization regulator
VIILSPVGDGIASDEKVYVALRASREDIAIGVGDAVPLRDTAAGYERAYHAVAAARHRPDRFAHFTVGSDLAALLGSGARRWARYVLCPLLDYEPQRPQDPDSGELCATLRSWLDFRAAAWRQLKIHRNTLLERLRHIESILGRDLARLSVQAEIHLALRLLDEPGDAEMTASVPDLDDLLAAPAVRRWAQALLTPLDGEPGQPLLPTVRAWLEADARPDVAAGALGISARGVRQRLVRAEQRIGRSLLGGPSSRYDVLMALRIRDRPAQPR